MKIYDPAIKAAGSHFQEVKGGNRGNTQKVPNTEPKALWLGGSGVIRLFF